MAVTDLYRPMDHLSMNLYTFFSVIESLMVIKLIWAEHSHPYCDWQLWHYEFTAITTRPNNFFKLNNLTTSTTASSKRCLSPQHRKSSHRNPACHIDLPPTRVKYTKEQQSQWTRMRDTPFNKTQRVLADDSCAVGLENVYVGNKENHKYMKPVQETYSVCICSFKALVSPNLCHLWWLMCSRSEAWIWLTHHYCVSAHFNSFHNFWCNTLHILTYSAGEIVRQWERKKEIRSHFFLIPLGASAAGEAIIRKMGEWVQDAGWEMDNSIRHGRQSEGSKQVRPVAPNRHLMQRALQIPTNHD